MNPADPLAVSYRQKIGKRPTGVENPNLLRYQADRQHSDTIINGVSRIGFMAGGKSAEWVDEDFPDVFTSKAKEFIRENKDRPFFLFYSFHDIHVPRLPQPRFQGVSRMGPRGDAIAQVDWVTGEIVSTLEKLGLSENTIVLFTSDNGPVLTDGYDDQALEKLGDHKPGGPFRGGKYSAFEAGTRVPTILSWPGTVKPIQSNALVSQLDFYASFANMLGVELSDTEAEDSLAMLDTLLGTATTGREDLLEESAGTLSLRRGQWKLIAPVPGNKKLPGWLSNKNIESGLSHAVQLYNLETDPGEETDVAASQPELVKELSGRLNDIVAHGY